MQGIEPAPVGGDDLVQSDPVSPPPYEYSWDFTYGLGPWTTWLPPSVVTEPGGQYEQFTRLQAPGPLDANHIDGIGAIWLVAHLGTATQGSPGVLNLVGAEFEMTVRGTDFLANGGKLALWLCRYVPETGLMENVYVGLQVTNWANTGGDMMGQITDDWVTITLQISDDPADWTYAGNYESFEGEWADRYKPFDLAQTLSQVDATLHLVVLNDDPDAPPSGFLDLANITVRTQTPATPTGASGLNPEVHYGLEDQDASGVLAGADGVDMDNATFSLVSGSVQNGSVTIDPDTGAFVFTPPANYFGPTDYVGAAVFQYTVTDGVNTSDPINVIVYIGGINDAPLISTRRESVDIEAGEPFEFTLFKGTDVDGDALTFELVDGSVVGGTLDLDPKSGHYVFTPTSGFTGEASFQYRVTDGHVVTVEKTVVLTVHPAGQAPALPTLEQVGTQYLGTGDMGNWVYYATLLAYAGDPNAAYHYATWLNSGVNGITKNKVLEREFLELAVGVVPEASLMLARLYVSGEGGERDYGRARELLEALPNNKDAVFRLAILDHLGLGAPMDKALAVEGFIRAANMGQMEAAYALGRRYLDGEGVGASASDAYFWLGVALKFGAPPGYPQLIQMLTLNKAEAAESLSPAEMAALDSAIAAWDPGEASPVNDAPSLDGADTVEPQAAPGHPVSGTLGEASDSDGDALTYVLTPGSAQHGTVVIDPETGAFTFSPTSGFSGTASFTYTVFDGLVSSAPRTVEFAVEAPTNAAADAGGTDETSVLSVGAGAGLLANDYAALGGSITVTGVEGQAANVGQSIAGDWGSVVIQADGSYVFTPAAAARTLLQGQTATDTFAYTITDGEGVSSTATLTITINGQDGTVINGSGTMFGTAFGDEITGGTDRDILVGQAGNDRLAGGSGAANELYGGLGDDTFVVEAAGDTIIENADAGFDTVETALATYTLRTHVEGLTYIGSGAFVGVGTSEANRITGGLGADVLSGLDGNDVLAGGAGAANELKGGAGDDIYIVSVAGDTLVEAVGAGTDTVQTALASYTLTAANVENLVYTGTGDFVGTGSAADNMLVGGAGNDRLSGGGGLDELYGGLGDDTYLISATDTVVELAGEGTDTIETTLSAYALTAANVENLTFTGTGAFIGVGNAGTNVLTGGTGNDQLSGGGGALDQLIGGGGDDLYLVETGDEILVEDTGAGTDTVQTALAAYTLAAANVENLTYVGTGSFTGTGSSAANILTGGAGDDRLSGGGGIDRLVGGLGSDTADYSTAAAAVDVRLNSNTARNDGDGATDVLSGIENLTGSAFNDLLIGDAAANVLSGGEGRDTLLGLDGNDILAGGTGVANQMQGGKGDDTYLVSAVGDTIVELAGEGVDTVLTSLASFRLGAEVEILTYTGAGAFTGLGNAAANTITGGAARDLLVGYAGNDTLIGGSGAANELYGGLGDDTYVISAVGDTIVEWAGEGLDTVQTGLSVYTLRANVEALTYTGAGAFTGTGNASANILTGGNGADVLKGLGGDDVLNGGDGTDIAVLQGLQADYQIVAVDGGWQVTDLTAGRDGIDLLYGVESLRFANGAVVSLHSFAAAPAMSAKDTGGQVLPGVDDLLIIDPVDLFPAGGPGRMVTLDDQGLISFDPVDPWFGA